MGGVLVVGSSNTDLVTVSPRLPRRGETVVGTSFATFAGGKGANQAVAASRAGAAVSFIGAVGDDDFGRQRLADLEDGSIDVSQVVRHPGVPSGVAVINVEESGENQIVMIPGANALVTPAQVRQATESVPYGVCCLVLEVPMEVVAAALRATRTNPHRPLSVLNAAPFDPRVVALLPDVDVLVCNEIEAAELLGGKVSAESAGSAVRGLRTLGCETAVITLGELGAVATSGGELISVQAPSVPVVDTTGAGDCFCGVFSAWLSDGRTLEEAVRAGVVAASLSVTQAGAQPSMPYWNEIVAALDEETA